MNQITLVTLKNPFNIDDREIRQVSYLPGEPVFQYARSAVLMPESDLVIGHNGRIVKEEEYHSLIPGPGDFIAICPVVAGGGGGGGGKNILKVVAAVAVMYFTFGAAAYLQGLNTFWGYVAAAGVKYVGGQIVSQMFPPPTLDLPNTGGSGSSSGSQSPTYGWGSLRAMQGQGNAVPVTFGTVRTAGQIVAQHVSSDGENQYLNLLLCGGEGPVDYTGKGEDSECVGIQNIKINDNPRDNYQGITVHQRAGLNQPSIIPGFGDTYIDQNIGCELAIGAAEIRETEGNNCDDLGITIECPYGLYHTSDQGNLEQTSVRIQISYRLKGASEWIDWETRTISGATSSAVRKELQLNRKLSKGQYEVRCIYVSNEGDGTRFANRVVWSTLSQIVCDDFIRPNKILLGIKALATDQLSGGMPTITWEQTRSKVWVYDPAVTAYREMDATNPAWACYDLIHRCKKLYNINTRIEEFTADGIPYSRIDYQAFKDWADFCDIVIDSKTGEKRCQVNLLIDQNKGFWEAVKPIEEIGRGKVILKGTRFSCICDRDSSPVQLFNVSNIGLDSFNEQFADTKDRANAIEVTFFNKEKGYQRDTVVVYADGVDEASAMINPTQITLYGCTSYRQAYREGKYRLRLNKYLTRTCSWSADIDAIACQIGDVVLVQHDIPKWGAGGRVVAATADELTLDKTVTLEAGKNYQVLVRLANDTLVTKTVRGVREKTTTAILVLESGFENIPSEYDLYSFGEVDKVAKPFRVLSISRDGDLKRKITGLEYIKEVYTEAADIPVLQYSTGDPYFEVNDLRVREETFRQKDGTVVSQLLCSWTVPRSKKADEYLIYLSSDNGTTWRYITGTSVNSAEISNVKTKSTYRIMVCTLITPIVSPGVVSEPVYITGKDTPPSDVPKLQMSQLGTKLKATISTIADPDVKSYELRMGPSWANSSLIQSFTGEWAAFEAPQEGTLTFWVKAVDNSGNYSQNPAKAIINVMGLPKRNIFMERVEDPASWQGNGVYANPDGWCLRSEKTVAEYARFSDIFGKTLVRRKDAWLVFPTIDLGANILDDTAFFFDKHGNAKLRTVETLGDFATWGEIFEKPVHFVTPQYLVETFANIEITYNSGDNARVDCNYRTSLDGKEWSDWIDSGIKKFYGRYLQIRLLPVSLNGTAPVVVKGARIKIDVPDVEDVITDLAIPEQKTTVKFNKKFTVIPTVGVFTQDNYGQAVTWRITGITNQSFDIELFDGDGQPVSGKLIQATIRGY